MPFDVSTLVIILIIVIYLISSIKILAEYERGVIFRLGRVLANPKVRASFWCLRRLTGSREYRSASIPRKFRRRTWSRATTSP